MIPKDLQTQLAGSYGVAEIIGSGSFGVVFRGQNLADGQPVAIKVFTRDAPLANSMNEMKLLFRLRHPHVIRVLDLFYSRSSYCLVFEFMAGGDLRQHMEHRLPEPEALAIAAQLADGLSYIHQQGIVHCDLKPENVLLERDNDTIRCKLADFNTSQFSRRALTAGNQGSPLYMAPEQFYDRYDHRADLYALGVLLYEMLAGQTPFEGSLQELMQAHIRQNPDLARCQASAPTLQLIESLLAKDPEQRPATADSLRDQLKQLLQAGFASELAQGEAFYLKYLDSGLRRYCYYVLPE